MCEEKEFENKVILGVLMVISIGILLVASWIFYFKGKHDIKKEKKLKAQTSICLNIAKSKNKIDIKSVKESSKYKVELTIEFSKKTKLKKAMADLNKLVSIVSSSPSVKAIKTTKVMVENKPGEYVEVE